MTVTDQGPETVIGHLFAPRAARIEPILSTTRQDELRKRAVRGSWVTPFAGLLMRCAPVPRPGTIALRAGLLTPHPRETRPKKSDL